MNPREIAVNILIDVFNNSQYNNISLRNFLKEYKNLSPKEKAFITELVNGTIRNLIFIDYIINLFSNTKTNKLKPFILNILRISIYQIKFMPNIPSSAICNEAVKITKKRKFYNLAGFVNAIIRNFDRNKNNLLLPDATLEPKKHLSILYSMPEWIIDLWLKEFDFNTITKICKANLNPPKISICVNLNKIDKLSLKNILQKEGMIVADGILAKNSLYISKIGDISESEAFKQGLFHIMDESSMVSIEALNPKPNKTLIDVCAAPGGKSFYSAYLMSNFGQILSRDIYPHKINLINQMAQKLGINIITAQLLDATVSYEEDFYKADFLLIDAPCSGFGILRKKPDIKYSKNLKDLNSIINLQRKILSSSHKYLKTGGTLIYSTCTINKRENLDNIYWFCKNYNYELDSLEDIFPHKKEFFSSAKKGYIQILPYMYNTDGFFIAKLKRKD